LKKLSGKLAGEFPELKFMIRQVDVIRVEADDPIRVGPLVRFLEDNGAEVSEAKKIRPSLEDVFVRITGIEADAMRREKEKAGGK
jgi:ABC-2 type transport system ATP-binding protein